MIRRPVAVEPVNVTMSTIGLLVSSSPTSPWPVITLNTPGGMPASSATWAMKNASSGVHGCGFSTTVQPAASAGADFTTLSMNGKLNGVIAATTPIGSRTIALPPTLVGPPVGGPISSHSTECWTWSAFDRNIPIEPPACTKSVMNPVEPVSATMSSRSSAPRDSRISAIRMSAAARSAGFIHGHGPSSNALRGGLDRTHRVLGGRLGDAADRSPRWPGR